jgi:hypothetical protein
LSHFYISPKQFCGQFKYSGKTSWSVVPFDTVFWRENISNPPENPIRVTRGRCYGHDFLRFSTIFGEKLAFFSKTNVMIESLHNLPLFCVKTPILSPKKICENLFLIITSVPEWAFLKHTVIAKFLLCSFPH